MIGVGSACLNHERFGMATTISTIRVAVDDLTRTTAVALSSQKPPWRSSSQPELWNLALPCILDKRENFLVERISGQTVKNVFTPYVRIVTVKTCPE